MRAMILSALMFTTAVALGAAGKWSIVSQTIEEDGQQLIDEFYTLPGQSAPCGEVLSTEDSRKLVRYYTSYKGSIPSYWYTTQREAEVFIEKNCD